MKLVKIAKGKINNIVKLSAYKVQYKDDMGLTQEKTLSLESPEQVKSYIRTITKGRGKVINIEEVARKPLAPKPSPSSPQRIKTEPKRTPRNVKVIQTPHYSPPPQTGFRINYYEDWAAQGDIQSKVYDVTSSEEAQAAFKSEFPNGLIVGNPMKLNVAPVKYDYDETGKPKDMSKGDWLHQRHMENMPR